ncbi:hypothetical protein AK830_g6409 [Neonectria ditissima]|uniref:Accumulation-associated protein n=1 Tax=Neonectria ditissima TaxID=78410 RepID=A0A0P7B0H8_9HYPO|nr:hypothetical protein AK830_g6409 [Neonectria ditissima]
MHPLRATLLALSLAVAIAVPTPPGSKISRGTINARNETEVPAGDEAAGEGEGEANEIEKEGLFGEAVALDGGDIKQDVLFPPGENGVLEVEFQNAEGRTLTVVENAAPAAPPAGFVALESKSYIIELAEGADGLTLSKVDYILTEGNALDISQGQIGRFCTEAGAFVIDPAVGELEFEVEENELTLTVANMNGEWGIFLPDAAAAGDGAAEDGAADGGAAEDGAVEDVAEGAAGSGLLDAVINLLVSAQAEAGKAAA